MINIISVFSALFLMAFNGAFAAENQKSYKLDFYTKSSPSKELVEPPKSQSPACREVFKNNQLCLMISCYLTPQETLLFMSASKEMRKILTTYVEGLSNGILPLAHEFPLAVRSRCFIRDIAEMSPVASWTRNLCKIAPLGRNLSAQSVSTAETNHFVEEYRRARIDIIRDLNGIDDSVSEHSLPPADVCDLELGKCLETQSVKDTLLFGAVLSGLPELVSLCLFSGANVNMCHIRYDDTPLTRAASELGDNAPLIIERLLHAKADVNLLDGAGCSALYWAAATALDNGVFKKILAAGANPNIKTRGDYGDTPLYACSQMTFRDRDDDYPKNLNSLIAAGAVLDTKDRWKNQTALMAAADSANASLVKALLKAGADVNARNSDGLSARDIARKNSDEVVEALLAEAEAAAR